MDKPLTRLRVAAIFAVCHGFALTFIVGSASAQTLTLLSSPPPNITIVQGATVPLVAEIHGPSYADVIRVDFYVNGVSIGTAATRPFTLAWTAGLPNAYVLTAVGRNASGARFPSAGVPVVVAAPAAPAVPAGHNGSTAPATPVVAPPPVVEPLPEPVEIPVPTPAQPLPALPAQALLRESSLVYEGAFKLPWNDGQGSSFRYGGKAVGFNRARGTIFLSGEELWMKVAELTVPEVRNTTDVSALDTAQVVQPLAEPTEGKYTAISTSEYARYGGILPYKGKLYTSIYHYYDANGVQPGSHFVSEMDLGVTSVAKGPFKIGALKTGYTSGFMTEVPPEWQEALGGPALTGNCCISIISRTSFGPAAFAFNPEDIGRVNPVPASPLVYYPESNPLAPYDPRSVGLTDLTSPLFNGTTTIAGVVFPEGTRSVLFFGRHGTGPFCYGLACDDPLGRWQGNHAWPYVYQVWAYDAAELALAKAGQKKPWEVKPYAVWTLPLPLAFPTKVIKGATYDPVNRRIFVVQEQQDLPLVHVYRVQ